LRQCQSLGVEFIGYDKDNSKKVWFKKERPWIWVKSYEFWW
jgi:hypothetical protein